MPQPFRRLEKRLDEARSKHFVGRSAELALFHDALTLDPPPFAVLWMVGPGGVGKSTLLGRFAMLVRQAGAQPIVVDARALVGTQSSLLDVLAREVGSAAAEVAQAFGGEGRSVLMIDTAEDLGQLEDWLREEFLPSLPARALVVIAGRRGPSPAWRTDPAWTDLLRVIALRNLSAQESRELLAARGIDPRIKPTLLAETHGHPLALALVADVLQQDPSARLLDLRSHPDVVSALLSRFVVDAPDDAHRQALEMAAHLRVINEEVLRFALGLADASLLYDWIASKSFSVPHAEGLYLHDLAAHAIDANHRRRNPESYVALHKRLRGPIIDRLRAGRGEEQYRAAMDLSWLHRFSAVLGAAVDWEGARSLVPSALGIADVPEVVEATRRFQGDAAASWIEQWIRLKPEAFVVVRSSPTKTLGYVASVVVDGSEVLAWDGPMDPRLKALVDHARATRPLRADDRFELCLWLSYETYVDPSALVSQMIIANSRTWFGTPTPTWSAYAVPARLDAWRPLMSYVDFHAIGDVDVGTTPNAMFVHDWRTVTPTAYLDMMAEREISGAMDEAAWNPPQELLALEHEEFVAQVKQALRDFCDDDALGANSLSKCRVAHDVPGLPAARLRAALELAVESLTRSGKDEAMHAALKLTYLDPTRTQEEAAELLGVPFSTFRRHLGTGIERVSAWLWEREMHGYPH